MVTDFAVFSYIDDKHCKVELDFPLASAECGRQVLVVSHSRLVAGDHDFAKFAIIPSIVLLT